MTNRVDIEREEVQTVSKLKKFLVHFGPLVLLALAATGTDAWAQCPTEPQLQNHTGGGEAGCTCFVAGEEAGAIFDLPPEDFPIQILKVGFGWGSAVGGQPDSLEEAFHIYGAALPTPGPPIFSQAGPQLTDGVINLFDVAIVEQVIVNSGPFMVSLEFANSNVNGGSFTPTVVHDNNGCQFGKNSVFTDAETWVDACLLGVSGDWVFIVEYRKVTCSASGPGAVPDGGDVPGLPLLVNRGAGATLDLSWSSSCSATDTTYSVYEGTLVANFDNHLPKTCDTAGATMANISPAVGDTYYLVVPRDDLNEGSYGMATSGPRAAAIATCKTPVAGACP